MELFSPMNPMTEREGDKVRGGGGGGGGINSTQTGGCRATGRRNHGLHYKETDTDGQNLISLTRCDLQSRRRSVAAVL